MFRVRPTQTGSLIFDAPRANSGQLMSVAARRFVITHGGDAVAPAFLVVDNDDDESCSEPENRPALLDTVNCCPLLD
jgi:hypothetical protein